MEPQFIVMPRGGVKKLADKFKVSTTTVTAALRYRTKSDKSRMLRAAALQHGGYVAVKPN